MAFSWVRRVMRSRTTARRSWSRALAGSPSVHQRAGDVDALALTAGELVGTAIVTTYDSDADTLPAIEAGATDYLLKDAPPENLATAVRTAAVGRTTVARTVADRLMDRLRTPGTALIRHEPKVLTLVAEGLSNQAIGTRLP